jgi:hypothetical protein
MTLRPLLWFYRLAAIGALTGILVGPQAMVAAACTEPVMAGHHQSHDKHRPAMPQHCCDLCSVACSGIALHGSPGSLALPAAPSWLAAPGFRWKALVVVSPRFLHPLALGPPLLLA